VKDTTAPARVSRAVSTLTDDQALELISQARQHLAAIQDVQSATLGVRKTSALQSLVRAAGASRATVNEASLIHIEYERRAGEILLELKQAGEYGPGRKQHTECHLPAHQVTHRWQDMARVPEEEVEAYVAKKRASESGEITSAELQRMGARIRRQEEEARRMAESRAVEAKPTVELSDCIPWLERQDPCGLLLTDPPYATDVEDISAFAESWLPLALSKVRPTGRAYVFVGAYPGELHAYLGVLLRHGWESQVLAWYYPDTLGPNPAKAYKSVWQAILYTWGPEAPPLIGETLTEKTTVQRFNMNSGIEHGRQHQWQKPDGLAERIVRLSSEPGDLVLDPFSGTGTFLLQASKLGRVARGCEADPEMLEIAVRRGCLHE